MSGAPSVLLADDHPLFRSGLASYFSNRAEDWDIIEAEDGLQALDLLALHEPDWAILDLAMPGKSGLEVLESWKTEDHATRFVVMSMHADQEFARRAEELGAVAFIAKEDATNELDQAMRTQTDRFYASESVGLRTDLWPETDTRSARDELTPTEAKILALLAKGMTSRDIASQMRVSIRTVQAHRRNMAEKLELRGPNKLMEYAIRSIGANDAQRSNPE